MLSKRIGDKAEAYGKWILSTKEYSSGDKR
jgi:hypothetical protein